MTKNQLLKKIARISLYAVLIILSIPLVLFLVLKSPKVQTFVVQEITYVLSQKLNAEISIGSVDYAFFNKLKLTNVFVRDQKKDTLIYSDRIYASLRGFSLKSKAISLGTVELNNGKLFLKQDSTRRLNLQFIIDAFSSKDTTKKKKGDYRFRVKNFKLEDFHFRYKKWDPSPRPFGMNYGDLDINHINLDLRNIHIKGSRITCKMVNLSAYEKCGFLLNHLGADVDFSTKEIKLNNAQIITPKTKLNANYIIFRFNGFKAWTDYCNGVDMDVDIIHSLVNFETISYFAPTLKRWNFKGYVDGRVHGPVAALRSNNFKYESDSTHLALNFAILGLPHAEQTVWKGNIQQLNSEGHELGQLIKTFVGEHGEQVSGIIGKLGALSLKAKFDGKFATFTSYAEINSSIGNATASLNTQETAGHTSGYNLNFSSTSLDLGKLFDTKKFGTLTATLNSSGKTEGRLIKSSSSNINVNGLLFNGYPYKNIIAQVERKGKQYDVLMNVDSKDANLTLAGRYNFENPLSHTIASAKINHINLHNLNLVKLDTIKSIRGLLTADFEGTKVDEINGNITLEHGSIESRKKKLLLGRTAVNITNDNQNRELTINSDLLDAKLKSSSTSSLMNIGAAINHFVKLYLPNLFEDSTKPEPIKSVAGNANQYQNTNSKFAIDIRIKKANDALEFFIPNLSVASGTSIIGTISPALNTLDLKLRSNELAIGKNHFSNINLQTLGYFSDLKTTVSCEKAHTSGLTFEDINLFALTDNNKIKTTLSYNNTTKESKNEGTFRFITAFDKNAHHPSIPLIDIQFLKSQITINDTPWNISNAKIQVDSTSIDIEDFKVTNQNQKLAIAGKVSANPEEQIHFIVNNLDIQNFHTFFEKTGYDIQGTINGVATLKGVYKSPLLFSNIKVNDAYINGRAVGSPELISSWDDETKKITINSNNYINDKEVYSIGGTLNPATKDIDLNIKINQLRAFLLEPYTKGIASNLKGYISGNLKITGKSDAPLVDGTAFLNDVSAKIDFLNTTYKINAPVQISQNEFKIKDDTLRDVNGHLAFIDASVTHNKFKDFKFDISILPKNILALNTSPNQNSIFYGNAFATGVVKIYGDLHNLTMRINAQTDKNTKVFIPLNQRTQVQDQNFITFVNPNSNIVNFTPEEKKVVQKQKSNLKILLDLNVTPDAEAQILLDPYSGSMLKAQGNSALTMEVDPSTNLFQIRGTYTIQKGNFRFNLLNLTSKDFSIDNGSTITWTGDPANATINVTATFKVRTTLTQLFAGNNQGVSNQRYNIECKTMLSGALMNPTIKFDIKIPEADPTTQTLVAAQLNNESQMQKQFISLLMIGQFFPEASTENNSDAIANAGKGMASDLIFSQLNNIVSQISNSIDIGVKYKPATSTSEQEYELYFSKNFFDGWVTVNGVVDVSGNTKSTGVGVAGDYDMEVRLDKKDKLKFKMFSYDQEDNMLKLTNTKQGVGITYQEQFGSFKDLFRRKKKKKETAKPDTTAVLPNNQKEKTAPSTSK